jgi:hypothetical protein
LYVQLEENSRLKDELMLKTQELHRIVSPFHPSPIQIPTFPHCKLSSCHLICLITTGLLWCPNQRSEATNQASSRGIHHDRALAAHTDTSSTAPIGTTATAAEAFKWGAGEPMLQDAGIKHKYLEATQANGIPRKSSGEDSAFPSQLSTPSSRSLSPTR